MIGQILAISTSKYHFVFVFITLASLFHSLTAWKIQKTLDQLVDLKSFDKNHRPPGIEDPDAPVEVIIDVVYSTIGPVSDENMEMKSTFYLHLHWMDPRLAFNTSQDEVEEHIISNEDLCQIWVPDLYFPRSKEVSESTDSEVTKVAKLTSTGILYLSQRIMSRTHCLLDLHKYPHDSQICEMIMSSYSHTEDELMFNWKENVTLDIETTHFMSQFALVASEMDVCTNKRAFYGNPHSCIKISHHIKRHLGFFVAHFYVPYTLMVVFSWCGFWITHRMVNARISVCLLTLLSTITLSSGTAGALPKMSYIKAIDWWMIVCLTFVFLTFVELIVVLFFSKVYKIRKRFTDDKKNEDTEIEENAQTYGKQNHESTLYSSSVDTSQKQLKVRGSSNKLGVILEEEEENTSKKSHGNTMKSQAQRKSQAPLKKALSLKEIIPLAIELMTNQREVNAVDPKDWGRKIDKCCQVIFPIIFPGWVIIYVAFFIM